MADETGRRVPTEALIARLASDLAPVSRRWPPRARLALWMSVLATVFVVAWLQLGVRPDLGSQLAGNAFGVEIALLLGVGIANAALALLASVPGREPALAAAVGSALATLGWVGVLYAGDPVMGAPTRQFVAMGWPCAARTIAVAAAPWLALLVAVRRGATLVPARAGLFAGFAAFLTAAAALRLSCPLDARDHLLVWHLGPVALGLGASFAIGYLWLARWRRS
jgi:hypothetical protein